MPSIKIEVTADGDFKYDKRVCFVRRGETIEWICDGEGFFAVHIGWNSPLEKGRYRNGQGKRISAHVPKDAPKGRYEYFVAVFDPRSEQVWTDDPEFIIKP